MQIIILMNITISNTNRPIWTMITKVNRLWSITRINRIVNNRTMRMIIMKYQMRLMMICNGCWSRWHQGFTSNLSQNHKLRALKLHSNLYPVPGYSYLNHPHQTQSYSMKIKAIIICSHSTWIHSLINRNNINSPLWITNCKSLHLPKFNRDS